MDLTTKPPLPRFDPDSGQNPFDFILRASVAVRRARAEREQAEWRQQEQARRLIRELRDAGD